MAPVQPTVVVSTTPTRQDILDLENDSIEDHGHTSNGPMRFEKRYRTQLATTLASVGALMASQPLQFCCTRLQGYPEVYKGLIDVVKKTFETESLRTFYSGVSSPLVSQSAVRIMSMTIYQKSKYAYSAWISRHYGIDPLVSANTPGEYPGLATITCFSAAGATAGFGVTFFSVPFEFVNKASQLGGAMLKKQQQQAAERAATEKALMDAYNAEQAENAKQSATMSRRKSKSKLKVKVQAPKPAAVLTPAQLRFTLPMATDMSLVQNLASDYANKGIVGVSRSVIKNRGFRGLWTGLGFQLARDTLGTAIYFATYETGKQTINAYLGEDKPTEPLAVVGASVLCGITSWSMIFPIDTIKTRYQRDALMVPRGKRVPFPRIDWNEPGLYRGLHVHIMRSVVTAVAFFSVFEQTKKFINALDDPLTEVSDLT